MSSVETNQNFNPSWMLRAYRGGHGNGLGDAADRGGAVISRVLGETDNKEYPLAPPVFVEHRYGREDLLALVGKDSRPPEGLERCQELFVEQCQQPVSIYPLSEREQSMIQNNINSSKAMSSLSPAERAQVLASGGGGTANTGFQRAGVPQTGGGWTPVKSSSWNRGNATNRGTMGRGGFTTGYPGRGGGSSTASQQGNVTPNEDGNSPYGQRYVPRNARGAPPNGRGGSTAVPSFNTRAQGLYNPKDPKDRPRARLRSTSEDDAQNTNGGANSSGWQPMRLGQRSEENGGGGNGWPRRNTTDGGLLPEWMNSDDEEPLDKPISISRESSDERNTGAAAQMMNSSSEPRQNREELNREQRPAWARQVSATGMAATNPQDVDRVLAAQERAVMEQRAQPTTTSAPPPTTSGYPFDPALFSGIPSEYSTAPLQPTDPAPPPKFYYMDPTKVERGPFEKDQMEQWFKIGYFETSLLLRRDTDREFKSLGELQAMNGAATPFDFKAPSPPPPQTSAQFGQMSGWSVPGDLAYLYGANQNTYPNASVIRQQIEQEAQRRLLIHQEEIYQQLLREQQKKDEQQRLEYQAREEQLRAYQEEIQRREQAMKETAKQLETRLEMERLEIEEKAKEVARERQRVAAIEEAKRSEARREEEEKKRLEEDRIRRELELRRLEEEQERKRLEEADRKKRAELAAENERRRLEIASREAVAQLKQREEAEKLKKDEELRLMAEREAERNRFQVTEDWETAGKPKKEAKEKVKVTPWSSTSAPREKTMAEIMQEEERQAAAERRQNEALRKEELRTQQSIQSAGTWSNAATRLASNPAKARASSSSAWGAVSSEPARVNPILDGPSLASANKVAPKPKPPATKAAPAPSFSKPTPKAQPPSLQQWATTRMKQLNEDVEAEVLYSFVADVDSPAEVEDYVIGYLGESKAVKEFVKEFIKKRSDARGGKKTETIASANSGSSEWTAQQTGKKKKGKGRTLVIDGSCLGFTPTGDPNRTNKGEIETVPLQSGSRR